MLIRPAKLKAKSGQTELVKHNLYRTYVGIAIIIFALASAGLTLQKKIQIAHTDESIQYYIPTTNQ
jgi:hypothetical protein